MPSAQATRLFVIGDSISIQYGPFLERKLGKDFSYHRKGDEADESADKNLDPHERANGGDSGMVLEYLRLRRQHNPVEADILLLNCGLHDIKTNPQTHAKQVPLRQYVENLGAILREARAMNLEIVWVRTTPVIDEIHNKPQSSFWRFAADVKSYNESADQVMQDAGVPTIDLHSFTESHLPGAYMDHVHFTEKVREEQAAFLAVGINTIWPR